MDDAFVPRAIIAGAQKAGTSAMLVGLSQVPGIWSVPPELHYFSENYDKGRRWYLDSIEECMPDCVGTDAYIVEKSPSYLFDADAAARIRDLRSDMKIIILLRNPVDRAFSRYNDILTDEPEKIVLSFDDTIRRGLEKGSHFIRYGCYVEQLERYIEVFGRSSIAVVVQERWAADPEGEIRHVAEFLGFDREFKYVSERIHANAYGIDMESKTRRLLEDFYSGPNARLFEVLGESVPEWTG